MSLIRRNRHVCYRTAGTPGPCRLQRSIRGAIVGHLKVGSPDEGDARKLPAVERSVYRTSLGGPVRCVGSAVSTRLEKTLPLRRELRHQTLVGRTPVIPKPRRSELLDIVPIGHLG